MHQKEWKTCGIYPSKKGPTLHLLIVANFTIGHGGSSDIKRHLASSKQHEKLKASSELKSFFQASSNEEEVIQAEILFAGFIAKQNLPFMIADHFSCHAPVMFSDSKIAKAFHSARTKTTCVLKGALYTYFTDPIVKMC